MWIFLPISVIYAIKALTVTAVAGTVSFGAWAMFTSLASPKRTTWLTDNDIAELKQLLQNPAIQESLNRRS